VPSKILTKSNFFLSDELSTNMSSAQNGDFLWHGSIFGRSKSN